MTKDNMNLAPLWTKNLIIAAIVNFLLYFGFQMLQPNLPVYMDALGANESIIGLATALFAASAILVRPVSGILLDKVGRRSILLIGQAIFFLSVMSYSIFPAIVPILIARFLHGFGWGAASTANYTMASDNIAKERFGEGIGYFSLAGSFAMAIGPILGLFILSNFNFKILFYSSAILIILSTIMSFGFEYKKIDKVKEKVTLELFEKTSVMPTIIIFFLTVTYGTVVSFISLYAIEQGIENIGLFFTVYAICLVVSRPLFGRIIDKLGFDYAIIPGVVLIFISMILLSFAKSLAFFLLIAFVYGIGFGAAQSGLQTMAIAFSPLDKRGSANATYFTGFDSGIGIGSMIYGYIATKLGYSQMFLLTTIPIVISLIVYLIYGRKKLETN